VERLGEKMGDVGIRRAGLRREGGKEFRRM